MAPERMSVNSLANEVDVVEMLSLDLPGRVRPTSGRTASLHWEFDLRSSWLDFFFKKREMPFKNIHFRLVGDDNVLGALELSTSEAGNSLHIDFSLKNSGIEPRCKPENDSTPPLDLRW